MTELYVSVFATNLKIVFYKIRLSVFSFIKKYPRLKGIIFQH